MPKRVLVACEYSGVVRDEFLRRGHDAWSCDLLPTESEWPEDRHITGDVTALLGEQWDLMIAHPPCTHLAVSGARHFKNKLVQQAEALDFVRLLLDASIPQIALENPVSIISSRVRKPDQIIQPWQFGHQESKKTCLWLKGLPKLYGTDFVGPLHYGCKHCNRRYGTEFEECICPLCGHETERGNRHIYANQTPSGRNALGPSPTRAHERSRTYTGIAKAMAEQWGYE